ncbi:acetyl-CoA C-acyltransferase, partial [Sphingomonas sp. 37zxx]|uniref:acetyl-CoA C-acyltransferase n=1 Tax=Sphingomonas sp. 37zxx TaxID=1550073 RepID=UPI00053BF72F
TQDVVIASGVEHMSRVPMGSTSNGAKLFSDAVLNRFGVRGFSQFAGAEMIAKKHGFTRNQCDAFALESHRRAAAATTRGDFADEIIALTIETPEGSEEHLRDEGIRFDASIEGLGSLKTLAEGGVVTAGNASQICDGASAVMVVSERALKDHGLTPLARIVNLTVTAGDPVIMLEEPLFATDRALQRAGMTLDQIGLYEVNEAFATVPLAWIKHTGADPARLNVNGGAIALGHPLGASGTKLMATLVHALRKRGGGYGLQTMCEGGGIANVTIIEAL